ncbi:MAG TPA: sialidase family protein [Candidatus Hydrogenedentes bacterium]|nr:sialidase family protein [Candidatus Hydrogenedentota bacterium]HQH53345.1 sialidase family protein [Candidatus Hydrogenedentota bacterium]
MKTVFTVSTMIAAAFCGTFTGARAIAGEILFEDVHAVPLPVQDYGYRSMPGDIIALNDGRLLLAYTLYTRSGSFDGAIGAKYSSDLGKTWGEEFALVPAPRPALADKSIHIYCHPSLLRLSSGDILLSYIYRGSMKPLFGQNYYRRSTDDGQSWGDQLIVTPFPGYFIMHNDKLVQLSTGRILAPVEFESSDSENDHAGYASTVAYSDDNGYSWWRSTNDVNLQSEGVEAQEPHVVELKDGRVLMLMRTYSGYVLKAYSEDHGASWGPGIKVLELKLPNTSSALCVKRIPSTGDLLLLRCSAGPQEPFRWRTPFVSILSKDEGETWTNERVLMGAPDNDYGYPSITFVENVALIAYHQRDGLHVLRAGLDWFYQE